MYKSCGFLGLFPESASRNDFELSGYEPNRFVTSCGLLGFGNTRATLADVPAVWKEDCSPTNPIPGARYDVSAPGSCTLTSCAPGSIRSGTSCVAPGTACSPETAQQNAAYAYDAAGTCQFAACGAGTVERPPFSIGQTGSKSCPIGYASITDAATCQRAAANYKIRGSDPFSTTRGSFLNGCVVHSVGSQAAQVSFNTGGGGSAPGVDQFLLCKRTDEKYCVKPGAPCNPSAPSYAWNTRGACQGKCHGLGVGCISSERCCSGTCVAKTADCPLEKSMKDEAAGLAHTIHALSGSLQQLGSLGK